MKISPAPEQIRPYLGDYRTYPLRTEILSAMRELGRYAGVFAEPAGAAGTAGLIKAVETGLIEKDASVVSIVTGNGLKDVANAIKAAGEPMCVKPDMADLLKAFQDTGTVLLS